MLMTKRTQAELEVRPCPLTEGPYDPECPVCTNPYVIVEDPKQATHVFEGLGQVRELTPEDTMGRAVNTIAELLAEDPEEMTEEEIEQCRREEEYERNGQFGEFPYPQSRVPYTDEEQLQISEDIWQAGLDGYESDAEFHEMEQDRRAFGHSW